MILDYQQWKRELCVVRGGGDIATGTIYKLFQCGFPLLVLEIANPSCIRRTVSFCEAVFDGEVEVEGVRARRADSLKEAYACFEQGKVPVVVDPEGEMIREASPAVVIDAILAKRNLGTEITDAPVVTCTPWWRPGGAITWDGSSMRERRRPIPVFPASLPVMERNGSSMRRLRGRCTS